MVILVSSLLGNEGKETRSFKILCFVLFLYMNLLKKNLTSIRWNNRTRQS